MKVCSEYARKLSCSSVFLVEFALKNEIIAFF